jgi:tetratricopeptide (TPR) repeat protein
LAKDLIREVEFINYRIMKKLLVMIVMLGFVGSTILAQSNKVASAFLYLKEEQPELAKPEIDAASQYDNTKNLAKTWFYRGNIYLQLHLVCHMADNLKKGMSEEEVKNVLAEPISTKKYKKLENGQKWVYPYELIVYFSNGKVDHWDYPMEKTYKALDDGKLLQTAYESYNKSLTIDPKYSNGGLNPSNATLGIKNVGEFYFNDGVVALQNKDYQTALDNLENANKIYNEIGRKEERIALYAGFAAESLKDTTKAIQYYSSVLNSGLKNASLYMGLGYLYLGQDKSEDALNAIQTGRKILPENQNLLLAEANIYMATGQAQKANELLAEAAKANPDNKQLFYAMGNNYDRILKDSTASEETKKAAFEAGVNAYKKATEIDPTYFDAFFNIGALYYNTAADLLTKAGNLPMSAQEEYDKLKKDAKENFVKSIPYLEKAHEIDATDHNTMVMLRTAYSQTGNTEGFKKIKAEMGN